MPPKRKSDNASDDGPSGRDRKKQKMNAARVIAVQSARTVPSNSVEVSSTGISSVSTNNISGLPTTIDVERFAGSRAYEINAMHEALNNAKDASTHRAWQELPRHLRRRAASHNVRRVPVRLREKAKAEMDPVKKKELKRALAKRGKSKRLTRTEQFLKRQVDKVWLETHIWHAKRMHMETKWGYRLVCPRTVDYRAITPTDKSARPSHRAATHGSILHDSSYFGIIELSGPQKVLARLLELCCDPQGVKAGHMRYSIGSRAHQTHLYPPRTYPLGLLGPVTIIWRSEARTNLQPLGKPVDPSTSGSARRKATKAQKSKSKEKSRALSVTQSLNLEPALLPNTIRTVWVRVHPAIFDDAHQVLHESARFAINELRTTPRTTADLDVTMDDNDKPTRIDEFAVDITDLREQLNAFEVVGPLANQVIAGALKPTQKDFQRPEFKEFWSIFSHAQTSGQFPRLTVVGFSIQDPRLSFPPKNLKARYDTAQQQSSGSAVGVNVFHSATLARSDIWDADVRDGLRKPRFKKKDIDARKSKNLIPGSALHATDQDDRIPVLLVQHSIDSNTAAQNSRDASGNLHGWTLIFPMGWAMPLLSSLVFTGTRVGGLRERAAQAFEAGALAFPHDYMTTAPYAVDVSAHAEEERARWERTPKSKRVNYEQRGIDNPWQPDWHGLLGLEKAPETGPECKIATVTPDFVPAQREQSLDENEGTQADTQTRSKQQRFVRPWVLCGPQTAQLLSDAGRSTSIAAGLHASLDRVRIGRQLGSLTLTTDELWSSALVWVRLTMYSRGKPSSGAMIFSVDDREARQWRAAVATKDILQEIELGKLATTQAALCGYVTSGGFSLTQGKTHAVGAITVAKYFGLLQQIQRLGGTDSTHIVKIRDRDDLICHIANVQVLCG